MNTIRAYWIESPRSDYAAFHVTNGDSESTILHEIHGIDALARMDEWASEQNLAPGIPVEIRL